MDGGPATHRAAAVRYFNACNVYAGIMAKQRMNRNGRGLFLGLILGAILGFVVGRFTGNPTLAVIIGAIVVGLLMYRVNPGDSR